MYILIKQANVDVVLFCFLLSGQINDEIDKEGKFNKRPGRHLIINKRILCKTLKNT